MRERLYIRDGELKRFILSGQLEIMKNESFIWKVGEQVLLTSIDTGVSVPAKVYHYNYPGNNKMLLFLKRP